jgi:hypothetical protein
MSGLPRQLADVLASPDAGPRLVRQSTAVFLVTPKGDVWRVFDSDEPGGLTRVTPGADEEIRARVFISNADNQLQLVYRFAEGEARSVTADTLQQQLTAANPQD